MKKADKTVKTEQTEDKAGKIMEKRCNSVFSRSRRQIVMIIMSVFLLVFVGTLAAVYILSYQELYQDNLDMLEMYVEQYRENGNPGQETAGMSQQGNSSEPERNNSTEPEKAPTQSGTQDADSFPSEDNLPDRDGARFALSSFYSVAFDSDGQASSVDTGDGILYSESQITEVAETLLDEGHTEGTYGNFVYCIAEEKSYTLVVLMDNTLAADSFNTLFRYTLLLGMGMIVVLLLCAIALARWIIRPLEESDRRQRQFISDAGHELKTPVAVIEANAELLEREIGTSQWLHNIRYESSRMAGLVQELLALVRTERETIQMEPLNFSRLVMGGVLPFESIAFDLGRQLQYQIAEDVLINGNAGQLSQLVSILMDNAFSHSEGEGNVSVRLFKEKSSIYLTVSNPGAISEEDRAAIFTRFYKGDAERNDTGHYGLGLTIAKNIAANHHGEIHVECAEGRVIFTVKMHS